MTSGIPFKLSLSSFITVKSVYIDGKQTEWKTEHENTKQIVSILCASSDSEIKIITDHDIDRDLDLKMGIIETEHNKDHVIYWENFIKDYFGLIPIKLNEISYNDDLSGFVLILAPNVVSLSEDIIYKIERAVKKGTGLIITSKFPDSSLSYVILEKSTSFNSPGLFINREINANKPFKKGEIISTKYEIPQFKEINGTEIVSVLFENSLTGLLKNKFYRYIDALFIESGLNFNVTKAYLMLADNLKLLEKKPCVIHRKVGEGKIIHFSFDPICSLGVDSRIDENVEKSAVHSNFLHLAISSIIDVSKFILIKGLYKEDKIPILYSVDVEASVSYYNPATGKCSSVGSKEPDTKMEFCLPKSAERLDEYDAKGTFHITTAGIYDKKDETALKNMDLRHDISLHMGEDGNHFSWGENTEDGNYILNNLNEGIAKLQNILKRKITGIRYPSWKRSRITHNVVNQLGLVYDTSSYAHSPFASIPFRMYSYSECKPLELWELPCKEMINIVKGLPTGLLGKFRKILAVSDIKNYVNQAYNHNGIIVLMDHDMSIGANIHHVHGIWKFDIRSFNKIMRYCYKNKKFDKLWITTGNEFINWYSHVRNISIKEFRVLKIENGSEFIISMNQKSD